MPHYHFHAADGVAYRDKEGEDLPDLEAAKNAALQILIELLPVKQHDFWKHKVFSVFVKDETGRMIATLTTTAVLDPIAAPDTPPET